MSQSLITLDSESCSQYPLHREESWEWSAFLICENSLWAWGATRFFRAIVISCLARLHQHHVPAGSSSLVATLQLPLILTRL